VANTGLAMLRFGQRVALLGCVGDDALGDLAVDRLAQPERLALAGFDASGRWGPPMASSLPRQVWIVCFWKIPGATAASPLTISTMLSWAKAGFSTSAIRP